MNVSKGDPMNNARYFISSSLLMTACLCSAVWETKDDMTAVDDAGYDICDYYLDCIVHRVTRCMVPIREDCFLRMEELLQARLSKRLFGEDKRTGKVKIKNIAVSSYLNRLG